MNNKKIKIAINGFGRIGRMFFKLALKNKQIEIVGINDLGDIDNMIYLLKYDSAQKEMGILVEKENNFLKIGEQKIPFLSERNPADLPWEKLEVDVVVECTGVFNSAEKSQVHLDAGARRVVLSGPGKNCENILMGVNEEKIKTEKITSNGSCTTNAVTLVLKTLDEKIGIENSLMTTIHSYTASQSLVDGPVRPGKDMRRGRAGAQNMIPTSTGSAKLVPQIYTPLAHKFDAIAVRVPTVVGSLVDLTVVLKEKSSVEEINNIFQIAEGEFSEILRTTSEAIVSSDIIGDTHPVIVDLSFTKVSGNLAKIFVWYDNEAGYSNTLLQHVIKAGENL